MSRKLKNFLQPRTSINKIFMILSLCLTTQMPITSMAYSARQALPFFRSPQSTLTSGYKSIEDLQKKQVGSESLELFLIAKPEKLWIPKSFTLVSIDLDIIEPYGLAYLPTSMALRQSPAWKSDVILHLTAGTKVPIVQWSDNWIQVDFQNLRGWIDAGSVITKYDFINEFYIRQSWHKSKYRDNDRLIDEQGQSYLISDLLKLKMNSQLAVAIKADEQFNIKVRNHFTILDHKQEEWKASDLNGHGLVYWKIDSVRNPIITTMSSDELLQKEVTSSAFHPKNEKIGLVSADGIWMTTDGHTWQLIPGFKNQNHPVSINAQGDLVVGDYVSFDGGKNFIPILKWEDMARRFESETGRHARLFRIKDVNFMTNKELQMLIETGSEDFVVTLDPKANSSRGWKFKFKSHSQESKAASAHALSLTIPNVSPKSIR